MTAEGTKHGHCPASRKQEIWDTRRKRAKQNTPLRRQAWKVERRKRKEKERKEKKRHVKGKEKDPKILHLDARKGGN